jgi:MFS family permease
VRHVNAVSVGAALGAAAAPALARARAGKSAHSSRIEASDVNGDGRNQTGRGSEDRNPSARSLRGLDLLNFVMADVSGGVGPYLAVFLKAAQNWPAGDIGIVMAVSSVAAAICQIPAGLLVDAAKAKRLLVAASGLLIAAGCLVIALFPKLLVVIAAQAMLGAASAVIPPAIAALSLGLVGHAKLDARVSRNQVFNHGGNFLAAVLAGGLGQYLGYNWFFYLVCVFAVASAAIVGLINPAEIDHTLARGGESADDNCEPVPFRKLLTRRDLQIFLVSVILFHFGNAAMLPMAGQVLALKHPGTDAVTLSACIIAAQFVMAGIAWCVGRAAAAGYGRRTIFLVALGVLPIRGLLFSVTANPYGVVAIQLLDGVAAGIFGVIAILIASDLMRGTGRFNLAQGLVALCVGIGAGLSNFTAGFVVQWYGYPVGFLYLAAIALGALAFFAMFMPETTTPQAGPAASAASAHARVAAE